MANNTRRYLGIDLGTTCVKIAMIDAADRKILYEHDRPHNANLPCANANWSEQCPKRILYVLRELLQEMVNEQAAGDNDDNDGGLLDDLAGIGISGQQHGIVLWKGATMFASLEDLECSKFYTWMDARCDPVFLGTLPRWTDPLGREKTVATGYGIATLAWLKANGQLQAAWDRAGTLMDFAAAYLTQNRGEILMCTQNAESWGFADVRECHWTLSESHGNIIPLHLLPRIVPSGVLVGQTSVDGFVLPLGVPVLVPIGDMQSTLLPILGPGEAAIHIGTSAQLVYLHDTNQNELLATQMLALEQIRPNPYFDKATTLFVAASLNGGNTMDCFVRQIADWSRQLFGHPSEEEQRAAFANIFGTLDRLFSGDDEEKNGKEWRSSSLTVQPTFFGERHKPEMGANVKGWRADTTLNDFLCAIAQGIVCNLSQLMPESVLLALGCRCLWLVGKARQPLLAAEARRQFPAMEVREWESAVSAGYGAALYAAQGQPEEK